MQTFSLFTRSARLLMPALSALALAGETLLAANDTVEHPGFLKPEESAKALRLPSGYLPSRFGKGKLRIDGPQSKGRVNCIFLTFGAEAPEPSVVGGETKEFKAGAKPATWRTGRIEKDGKTLLRREAILPNPFPREKSAVEANFLNVQVDAETREIMDQLTLAAEELLAGR